ncbi:hypothetical protein Thermo_01481 [Thermoplasmatales archaeon]|nr:hypothetical protein Thermo_01481 [Thermoplasmatales archaeon]
MDKNKTRKTEVDEEAKSVLLDGEDYLVLELLKWPGETDRETIQRILREAIEMPKLKEFVEKLGQQITKMMDESRDFVTITGLEESLENYKTGSTGREHHWQSVEPVIVPPEKPHEEPASPKVIELPEKPVSVPQVKTEEKEENEVENIKPPELQQEVIVQPPVRPRMVKPIQMQKMPNENPRLVRELISGKSHISHIKPTVNEKSTPKRYPKGSKEYEDEILRMKQALEGPWTGY